MKAIYSYDQKSFDYLGARLEPDDYDLMVGETLITPPSNLTKRKFDVEKQKWTGEKVAFTSTPEQKLLMEQSQQITILQNMVMQQNQAGVKLQAANQQQTDQIKQLRQMFMTANQQQAVEKSKEANAQ